MDNVGADIASGPDPELRKANLQALAGISPSLARMLENFTPAAELLRNEDGDWDVAFRGQYLYGPGGRAKAERDAAAMAGVTDGRIKLNPPSTASLDALAAAFVYNTLKLSVEEGLSFNQHPNTDHGYHLISFGFGLGYHLPKLMEVTDCRSLCIVEPNLDFLYHSLDVCDWSAILEPLKAFPRSIEIVASQDADEIAQRVRQHCRSACPIGIDWSLVVHPYPNVTMAAGYNQFMRDAGFIPVGLGFIHDEMEMTRASYRNLCETDHKLFAAYGGHVDTPAFVIGSGPSIDRDIAFLKENQQRAIIFSCGTAARVLLANGIQPDFQVLLENGEPPADAMLTTVKEYPSFADAVLIAANTVSPRARTIFKDTVFFFRPGLSSYTLFSISYQHSMGNPGPTVTNTGLSTALALGFRDIYLFGTDLGSRDPSRHHSRHSLYRHDGDEEVDGGLVFDGEFDKIDVGNFGGTVYTDYIMSWSRDAMMRALKDQQKLGQQVFNCSDGLIIPGSKPKASAAIRLQSSAETKARDMRRLLNDFPAAKAEDFRRRWAESDWLERIRKLAERVVELADAEAADDAQADDAFDLMARACELLITDFDRLPTFEEYFIRGSVLNAVMAFDYYIRRVHPPERRGRFRRIARDELVRIVSAIVRQTEWFFENIDELKSYEELEDRLREWSYD